ncbi:hypothetical protein [Mycobacterium avium]|uniref:hypothetical protein n=1 Tax=Mycobacterium avium TaxID=1764 RepID=UPI001CC34A64|nr:hypothetical protein [Mycobacterium avium]MBZ4620984.1 hypothetical protein [Mycobacterium avium subsp. hominissuis]
MFEHLAGAAAILAIRNEQKGATIMAQPTDIAPPPSAEADIWLDAGYRDIYQTVGTVNTCDDIMRWPLVTAVARQYRDGHLDHIAVEVDDANHEPLTADQARLLAFLLIDAANVVDAWNGIDNDPARLGDYWGQLATKLEAAAETAGEGGAR